MKIFVVYDRGENFSYRSYVSDKLRKQFLKKIQEDKVFTWLSLIGDKLKKPRDCIDLLDLDK